MSPANFQVLGSNSWRPDELNSRKAKRSESVSAGRKQMFFCMGKEQKKVEPNLDPMSRLQVGMGA